MWKKLTAIFSAAAIMCLCCSQAFAYDVVSLPKTMTMAEALEIYSVSDIAYATVSNVNDEMFIELSDEEIKDFYYAAQNIELMRRINPTPFRGTAINLYTVSGDARSFYLTSGVEIGLYGESNYICYNMSDEDLINFMYLDSLYKESEQKLNGETINRRAERDFLRIPEDPWAVEPVKEAARRSLLPYELTFNYGGYISREYFCMLLGSFIAVAGGYSSIDAYMQATGQNYLLNYFSDCDGRDPSISILYCLGIVNGKGGDIFDPESCITRQEAAKMLTEAASKFTFVQSVYTLSYDDNDLIAPWAEFYVKWVSENGIMSGIDATHFDPTGYYTQQQAITTVTRLFNICAK